MPLLEELSWVEAEPLLTAEAVVAIPLGAAAKEHGPHLKLKNDFTIAEFLKHQVAARCQAVVAPTVPYFFYPAFVDYPGSVSLSSETSMKTIVEICQSLSRFGPRRFYVINTGISTLRALRPAAEELARSGVLLRFTDWEAAIAAVVRRVSEQEGGSHADEIETSIMLHIAEADVDMSKAAKDFDKFGTGRFSRTRQDGTTYSPTGIWGDATLASADKGRQVVQSLLECLLAEIEDLRQAKLPATAG